MQVIKVLWSEPIGFSGDNLTVVTMEQKFAGEKVAVKIRWFVVIMEGDKWCTCLYVEVVTLPTSELTSHQASFHIRWLRSHSETPP